MNASQVHRIDDAQKTLTAARDSGDRRAIAQADAVLNAVVRNSGPEGIRAWAAMANLRDGWGPGRLPVPGDEEAPEDGDD